MRKKSAIGDKPWKIVSRVFHRGKKDSSMDTFAQPWRPIMWNVAPPMPPKNGGAKASTELETNEKRRRKKETMQEFLK